MNDVVEEFFSKEYESKINKNILYYSFPDNDVRIYIDKVINEPISRYLTYIDLLSEKEQITSKDIFQFSSFEGATYRICDKLKSVNNPGMKFLELGQLLLDDNKERKDGAFVKYGENHAKTAESLGLVFELCHTYYLSCVGYIFTELNPDERKKLLVRLILRNKLIKRMYQASKNGNISAKEFLYMISESTYVRRRSNVKNVFDVLVQSPEHDFSTFVELVKF